MSNSTAALRFLATAVSGYLLGSLPSGVLMGRLFGMDPRGRGSGKTGATNVLRTLGTGPAVVVAALDVGKGAAAALLPRHVYLRDWQDLAPWGEAVGGVAALVGHNHSIFIHFTGGRGVLTGAGAMAVMSPLAWLCGFVAALLPIAFTRYVSLGSILGAAASPAADLVLVLRGRDSLPHLVFLALAGGYVIASHRDNIRRLLDGTERRLGQRG